MESSDNEYQLKEGERLYFMNISIVENKIRLSCKDKNERQYLKDFSTSELKLISPFFDAINSEEDAINILDKALLEYKVALIEENGNLKVAFHKADDKINKLFEIQLLGEGGIEVQPIMENVNYFTSQMNVETVNTYTENVQENNENINANEGEEIKYETGDNFDLNAYLSQNNVESPIEGTATYEGTVSANFEGVQNDGNYENYQVENNQYEEAKYDTENVKVEGDIPISYPATNENDFNEYNNNIETENNYNTTTYETTSNTQLNEPFTYENTNQNYEFAPSNIEQTTTTTYETSTTFHNMKETLPSIAPADPMEEAPVDINYGSNEYITQTNEYNEYTTSVEDNLQYVENPQQPQYNTQMPGDALKDIFSQIGYLRSKINELSSIKAQLAELQQLNRQASQIEALKILLQNLQFQLNNRTNDTEYLKNQIAELEKTIKELEEELENLRKPENLRTQQKTSTEFIKKKITVKGEIIHGIKDLELITKKINKQNQKITLNLIYKATVDSDKARDFHEKCDAAKSTIVLIETDKGKRFGGYTSESWSGNCINKKDDTAFIFSLDKMKTYDVIEDENAIGCYPSFGPTFLGCQIKIFDDTFVKGGTTFEKGKGYYTKEDFELTDGDKTFLVKEMEVYEVIQQ